MSNEKFYEAVLREELPISREFADKGWPPLLYPWFLAVMQFPEGDLPKRRAFMHHMGDCIRAGVLPAVRQRIPWFIERDVIEPHISARDFLFWLQTEGKEPSPLVSEWLTAHGVGREPIAESAAIFPLSDFDALVAYRAGNKGAAWTDGNQLEIARAKVDELGAAEVAQKLGITRQTLNLNLGRERKRVR